jgi:Rrf2 family protein
LQAGNLPFHPDLAPALPRAGRRRIRHWAVAKRGLAVHGGAMLSQRTRYTIRALLHLADRYGEGPVQLTEIAQAQNLPPKFLTVILSQMRRAGLVETMRGREGGYWLAKPPSGISYGEIVRLTRGSLGLLPCASRLAYEQCKNCISEDKCRLHRAMLMVRDETARILDGLSLADPVPLGREP